MDMDDEDVQIRQMMGFSTFGGKPKHANANKKQDKKNSKQKGTASNLTPLGHRPALGKMSGNMTIMSESETPGEGKPNEQCSREAATDSPAPVTLDDKDKDENYEDSTNPANLITTIPQQSTKPTTQSQPSEQINSISDPLSNSNSDTDTIKPTYHFNDVIQPKSFPTPLARQQWESAIGWTSPWTGETFTNKLLVEYARGRWEEKPNRMTGKVEKVLVFFKPSFVDPDPWRGLVGVDEEEVERRREASREESRRLGLR